MEMHAESPRPDGATAPPGTLHLGTRIALAVVLAITARIVLRTVLGPLLDRVAADAISTGLGLAILLRVAIPLRTARGFVLLSAGLVAGFLVLFRLLPM